MPDGLPFIYLCAGILLLKAICANRLDYTDIFRYDIC